MLTIRINVGDTGPLDGSTPLPPNSDQAVRPSVNNALQIYELDLPNGQPFGLFDPGELGLLGKSGSYLLRHCTVWSIAAQKTVPHNSGCKVEVVSPEGPGGFTNRRTIIDLGASGLSLGSGIVPEGSGIPIPVGHKIAFDTLADELIVDTPGPHLVQMTFMPAKLPQRVAAGTLRTGFPQSCVPPVIVQQEPTPLAFLFADGVSQTGISLFGTGFEATDNVVCRQLVPFPGAELSTYSTTFVDSTQWDITLGPTNLPPDAGLYEIVVERGSNALCFDSVSPSFQVIPPA